jgi:RimJ/RimL family protein N-acetyltransferase
MMGFKLNLETKSFSLIQTQDFHFDELYLVASNPVVWEQHPEKNRWKKEVFLKFFQTALNNDLGCFTIIDKNLDKYIGSTRFYSHDRKHNSIKIGYTFLSPEYWGSSANGQIKKVMLNYIFGYVEKVYFDIGEKNFRSRRATEKLGAVQYKKVNDGTLTYLLHKKEYFLQGL